MKHRVIPKPEFGRYYVLTNPKSGKFEKRESPDFDLSETAQIQ